MITGSLNGSWLRGLLHRVGHREISNSSPKVLVIGVGGAGGNALNNMIRGDLRGVEFCAVNTDVQALAQSLARRKMQIGPHATRGLGAGARVGFGQIAAEESLETIKDLVRGNDIVFVTAGMGGGTGTGAAPVIAGLARRFGILTVGVITKPFDFEGEHRLRLAEGGVAEMEAVTDTLLVIPNQNLFRVADKQTTLLDAFRMADEVLHAGVRAVTDLMTVPGLVNLDFADVRTIMKDMGQATMGTGEAGGENRASIAAAAAMSNPLIEQGSMSGARGVLINVTGGADLTLFDMNEAVDRVRREAAPTANIIFGSTFDKRLRGRTRISVVATGIGPASQASTFEIRQSEDIADCEPWGRSADDEVAASPIAPSRERRRGLLGAATGLVVIAAVGAGGAALLRDESAPAGALEASDDAAGAVSLAADTIPAAADVIAPSGTSQPPAPSEPNVAVDGPAAAPPAIAASDPKPKPPKHKPKAPRPVVVQAVPGQSYTLQIGALRDAESAQEELTRLRRTQADLLTGLDGHASRFELVDQGSVWRIRVGPIADRATAETICSGLKQRGAQCLLLGPSAPVAAAIARQ